jgi:hypothetical protein
MALLRHENQIRGCKGESRESTQQTAMVIQAERMAACTWWRWEKQLEDKSQ